MPRLDDRLPSDSVTAAAGLLLLVVGVVAVACAAALEDLGTGGRSLAGTVGVWAVVVGGLAVRDGLRSAP